MTAECLPLLPTDTSVTIPVEIMEELKLHVVPVARAASESTLRMTELDPAHTPLHSIGTYFRNNFVYRLDETFSSSAAPELRVYTNKQFFELRVDSSDGIMYSFPVHRCDDKHIPTGGRAFKKRVRSKSRMNTLIKQAPHDVFIGVTYHQVHGIIEIFIGRLVPSPLFKVKYTSYILDMIYTNDINLVDTNHINTHESEEIDMPHVEFRRI